MIRSLPAPVSGGRASAERVEKEGKALRPLPREWEQECRETRVRVTRSNDIAYVDKGTHETSALFEFVGRRYRSLMVTTNQPFSTWERIFADKAT